MPKWPAERIEKESAGAVSLVNSLIQQISELQQRCHELEAVEAAAQTIVEAAAARQESEHNVEKIAELYGKLKLAFKERDRIYVLAYDGDYEAIMEDFQNSLAMAGKKEYHTFMKPIMEGKKLHPESFSSPSCTYGFVSYRGWIVSRCSVPLEALQHFKLSTDIAYRLIDAQASAAFYKPKSVKPLVEEDPQQIPTVGSISATIQATQVLSPSNCHDIIPNGPLFTLAIETLNAGRDISLLPLRKQKINRRSSYEISKSQKGDDYKVKRSVGEQSAINLTLTHLQELAPGNSQIKKIFTKILMEASKQAIGDGELRTETISFPLSFFVESGQYSSLDTARVAFNDAASVLQSMKASGYISDPKKKRITQSKHAVLFPTIEISESACSIRLNPDFNWALMMQYFTILPNYYFELPGKAADLLALIFQRARLKKDAIAKGEPFFISNKAVLQALSLPDPEERKVINPGRDIKAVIERAIEDIEKAAQDQAPHTPTGPNDKNPLPDIQILPIGNRSAKISDYLSNGKLQITIKGEYAARFQEISAKENRHLINLQNRKNRVSEKAEALRLANSSKEEPQKPDI